jgi:hypothetical protein
MPNREETSPTGSKEEKQAAEEEDLCAGSVLRWLASAPVEGFMLFTTIWVGVIMAVAGPDPSLNSPLYHLSNWTGYILTPIYSVECVLKMYGYAPHFFGPFRLPKSLVSSLIDGFLSNPKLCPNATLFQDGTLEEVHGILPRSLVHLRLSDMFGRLG